MNKLLIIFLSSIVLAGCATPTTTPSEYTYCLPPYDSGLVTCKTYKR